VRALATAGRERETLRIKAEAEAQTLLVKQVKAAEASEEAAKHAAKQKTITADAELDTADKLARAKIRLAEGTQAEAAAEGLARARVKEADAVASEKLGLTEARVTLEKLQAVAAGEEKQGLAKARVKKADAEAVQSLGTADASALREKLLAEATGIAQKAESMKALDASSRGHEEFRLNLDKERAIALETIHAKRDVAASQAQILAQAFSNAKFNIVGGDGQFFDRFIKAVSVGQAIDGVMDSSDNVKSIVQSAMRPDDEAVLGMIEKLVGGDGSALAKLKAGRKPAGSADGVK
jgi:hypothetical protein